MGARATHQDMAAIAVPPMQHELTARLGPRIQDETDARSRLDRLAESNLIEEEGQIGRAYFSAHICNEQFPSVFTLPFDTPKYNGSAKVEEWLLDYTNAVGIT
ncbi:DNA mismatch repair protein Mlh1 [Hordeum vulgare]|nr:DNA mismatch repair protein Mlh1 [Hordeum vulgare]